jgi:hypothetical protein
MRSSISERAERMQIGQSSPSPRNRDVTVTPSRPGSPTSSTMMSGARRSTSAIAVGPSRLVRPTDHRRRGHADALAARRRVAGREGQDPAVVGARHRRRPGEARLRPGGQLGQGVGHDQVVGGAPCHLPGHDRDVAGGVVGGEQPGLAVDGHERIGCVGGAEGSGAVGELARARDRPAGFGWSGTRDWWIVDRSQRPTGHHDGTDHDRHQPQCRGHDA